MKSYSIKNQEDFNRIYPTLPTIERGKLGRAFPEYYDNYMNMSTRNYQEAQKIKSDNKAKEAERKINEALRRDVREETLKAVAGKPNKYFKPFENQEQRNKYANYLKQQKALKSAPKYQNQYMQMIYNEAVKQGIDPNLALAVAYNESRFNPNSKNISKGDPSKGTGDEASYGLFQINTLAHPDYKGGLDPQKNIEYGIRLLKGHLKATGGDVKKALERYNGSGLAARNYSNRVYGIYQDFSKNGVPQDIKTYTPSSQPTSQVSSQVSSQPIEQAPQINMNDFSKVLDSIYSSQNAQEGALNNFQDIQYLDLNRPALMGQQMASNLESRNPSSSYLDIMKQGYQNTYDLAKQAGGYGLQQPQVQQPVEQRGQEDMIHYNDFNDPNSLSGYVTPNTMAPVPTPQDYSNILGDIRGYAQVDNQPQGIREDVLADYLKVIEGLRNQNAQTNQQAMAKMKEAQEADAKRNYINQMVNTFGALGEGQKAPFYYIGAKGDLRAMQQAQPNKIAPLPTDTTTNVNKLASQLALQAKAQQSNKDIIDAYKGAISAQEASKVTGLPAGLFLDPDLYKTYAQYIQNPEIAQQAQFKREAGMAPINLSSDLSKQALINAGNLDVAGVNAQAQLDKTGLAGEYTLANTQLANAMQGANDYRKALLQSQTQQNINKATLMAQVMMANMNNETKLEVAKQSGANALQLAQLQDDLYSNNPVRVQNANAQILNAMTNVLMLSDNPEQGFALADRILGNQPQGSSNELSLNDWND